MKKELKITLTMHTGVTYRDIECNMDEIDEKIVLKYFDLPLTSDGEMLSFKDIFTEPLKSEIGRHFNNGKFHYIGDKSTYSIFRSEQSVFVVETYEGRPDLDTFDNFLHLADLEVEALGPNV